jgi:hypothetical protein
MELIKIRFEGVDRNQVAHVSIQGPFLLNTNAFSRFINGGELFTQTHI